MANQYKNKVVYNGATLIDLTGDTVTAANLAQGITAHDASGAPIIGTMSGGSTGAVWQDQDGYIHLSPDAGGGSVTVESLSVTQNGTYTAPTGTAYSPVTVNVSGGASNFITGTFTGTTSGTALEINIPYSGNGYPIAVVIYPTEGPYNENVGNFYSLIQRYAVATFYMIKNQTDTPPDYSTSTLINTATGVYRYKSSTTSAITYSQAGFGGISSSTKYVDQSASSGSSNFIFLRSKNQMSVFIADTSYGFAANIEYTYHVIYSS